MLTPRTFYGYDQTSRCIVSCPAADATSVLNPNEVKAAIENLENVFVEEMKRIASALHDVTTDANEAIIVQGTKMSATIDDTANAIIQIPAQVIASFAELYDYSIKMHDALQQKFNDEAYNAVCTYSGVVRVTG